MANQETGLKRERFVQVTIGEGGVVIVKVCYHRHYGWRVMFAGWRNAIAYLSRLDAIENVDFRVTGVRLEVR
jgi:hypothetical protein